MEQVNKCKNCKHNIEEKCYLSKSCYKYSKFEENNDGFTKVDQLKIDKAKENIRKQQGTALTATHYQREGLEPIQEMQANYTKEEFTGFLKGTAKKYQDRLGRKTTTTEGMCEDITKAMQYLYWLKLHLQGVKIEPMKHVLEEKQ